MVYNHRSNNHRKEALHSFNKNKAAEPRFGIEQEFYIMDNGGQYMSKESKKSLGQKMPAHRVNIIVQLERIMLLVDKL